MAGAVQDGLGHTGVALPLLLHRELSEIDAELIDYIGAFQTRVHIRHIGSLLYGMITLIIQLSIKKATAGAFSGGIFFTFSRQNCC
jgi:hypothetical protein